MKKYFFILAVTIFFSSCKPDNTQNNYQSINTIQINATEPRMFYGKNFVKKIDYILLSNKKEAMFTEITKIKFKNKKFYILDVCGENHVYIYNEDGTFLKKIGRIGKGPGEYSMLCDIDIDPNGFIYLYNSQQKKIQTYDSAGNFLFEKELLFRADALNLLKNNKFIFSLKNEKGNKKIQNAKIALTDSNLELKTQLFKYHKDFMDNRERIGLFSESTEGIIYNKPADDIITVFNYDGYPIKSYMFNFGVYHMPEIYKNDAFLKYSNKNNPYKYLLTTPVYVNNLLMGNIELTTGDYKHYYCYSFTDSTYYENELTENNFSHENINFPLATIGDSIIISYLDLSLYSCDYDMNKLPKSVSEHLQNFGTVLLLYHLK